MLLLCLRTHCESKSLTPGVLSQIYDTKGDCNYCNLDDPWCLWNLSDHGGGSLFWPWEQLAKQSAQQPATSKEGRRRSNLSSFLDDDVQAKGGTLCVLRESEGHCRCTSASKRNGLLQCHPLSTDALGSFCFPGHVDISLVSLEFPSASPRRELFLAPPRHGASQVHKACLEALKSDEPGGHLESFPRRCWGRCGGMALQTT